ncbi:heme ABC transporter ATP-binding protein [Euzebya rosea]|uniref:heme ABC transporter ATP-binding protein n=1 Tax=Euzebya rosea TaxID=2052804 RepID=UPI00130062FD|nr:heme ABC transporter ATP-binding protein [Euzebya rosea]
MTAVFADRPVDDRPTPHRTPRRAAGTALLALRQVGVARRDRTILHDLTVEVAAGELVAVVGANGAGKSTLLHAVSGDLSLASGTVELDGAPLSSLRAVDAARRRAVLTQDATVAFPFSVRDVVMMGRAPWHGTDAAGADDAMVDWALEAAGVAEMVDRPVTQLSGGERARVMLARTLAQDTPLLLLDEPVAALDPHHADRILAVLAARARAGDAVVVVLHDLTAAAAWSDRIVLLAGGGVLAAGLPQEVMTAELLGRAYGAPMEVVAHPRTGAPIVLPAR